MTMNVVQSTTNNNNTIYQHSNQKTCAACKHQRNKCAPDCILAPYFPHGSEPEFLNAYKLYGVRNMTKIVENLSDEERNDAMKSIIFESNMRAANPITGCCRMIQELILQIRYYRDELQLTLQQLANVRPQNACHDGNLTNHGTSIICDPNSNINADVPSSVSNYQCAQPAQLTSIDNTHDGHLTNNHASSVVQDHNNNIIADLPSSVSNYQCAQPRQSTSIDNTMALVNMDDDVSIVANDDVNLFSEKERLYLLSVFENRNGGAEHISIDSLYD